MSVNPWNIKEVNCSDGSSVRLGTRKDIYTGYDICVGTVIPKEDKVKLHYFNQEKADESDIQLKMAKGQGYVPEGCLLAGIVVMDEVNKGNDPCAGCNCERGKCDGRDKKEKES